MNHFVYAAARLLLALPMGFGLASAPEAAARPLTYSGPAEYCQAVGDVDVPGAG